MGLAAKFVSALGGSMMDPLKDIALEYIQTDKESAEAKSLFIKTLDPNGNMRRNIMDFITNAYAGYLILATFLIVLGTFEFIEKDQAEAAFELIKETFMPVTGLFGALATASFGVSATNVMKGN
jgi:hypothetical protein